MNTFCYNEVAEFAEIKQKLLEWLTLWKNLESEKSENINADVTELSIIAQLMGYKLESFQTQSHLQNIKDEVKIEITCLKSGVRSVLHKPRDTCSCPPDDVLEKGQFWNVFGVGSFSSHSSQTSISNSESSLLPKLSNTTKLIIKGLLKKIIGLIVKDDQDAGMTIKSTFTRHNSWNLATNKKERTNGIKRTNSFDITSNYKPNPCTSTPDVGLSNGNRVRCAKCNFVKEHLLSFKKTVTECLEVISSEEMNATSKINISPRISDIKPTEGPAVQYIREMRGFKNEVKAESPKFRTVVRRCDTPTINPKQYKAPFNNGTNGILKTGTTGIPRKFKIEKTTNTPSRLPKRKM